MVPCSRAARVSRFITSSPETESSEPVGSSANRTSRPGDQAPGQRDALRLAAGQLPGPAVLQPVQAEPGRTTSALASGPPPGGCRPAAAAGRRSPRRSARGQAGRTGTRSRTCPAAARCAAPPSGCPAAGRRTRPRPGRGQDAGQAVQQGRLARPARAHDGEDLAPLRVDAGAAQRRGLAERFDSTSLASIIMAPLTGAPPRASASSRAAVWSIQRKSASRWYRPWSASRVSTRLPSLLERGELAHPLQVRGALKVQVAVRGAVQHEGEHDLGEQHRLQVRFGRGRSLGASCSTSATPSAVMT